MLEVEVKANCLHAEEKLFALGAEKLREEEQEDTYFNSPWRDFSKSDEALRIRKVDGRYVLTYKGPKLDLETKTREEIEAAVGPKVYEILKKAGFIEAAVVKKRRKIFQLDGLAVSVDYVEALGEFVEIESGDLSDKEKIFDLLRKLGIDRKTLIRKSYLELLEEKKNHAFVA